LAFFFFFSSRRRHTRFSRDWSSDVCSSDLIIDSQEEVGGYPELKSETTQNKDSDEDGMPDQWEKENCLDPEKNDSAGYDLDKNFTNIEVYINSLVETSGLASTVAQDDYHMVVASDGTGDFRTV